MASKSLSFSLSLSLSLSPFHVFHQFSFSLQKTTQHLLDYPFRCGRKDSWKKFEKKQFLFQEAKATKHGKKDKGNISFQAINLLVSFLIISDNTFDGEGRKSSKLCKITANLIHQVGICLSSHSNAFLSTQILMHVQMCI
jgi:hypothetical protein